MMDGRGPAVQEALTSRAADRIVGAHFVVPAECAAPVVAELKLGRVPMKVLLSAVLIDAFHASLEHAEIAFDRVRMDMRLA
jgi:hypothetical protein